MGGLFYTKSTMISMLKSLCDAHSDKASYVSIGKSFEGRDIMLFRIGNPNGGKVSLDGAIHGWEDIGSVLLWHYANWLLTSGDAEAQRILTRNYTLLIPYINMDSTERENRDFVQCQYGVDLNRNFMQGWTQTPCGAYPNNYHGKSPASEPETQVMRNFFSTYKPKFHLNMHYGGGPYLAYDNLNDMTVVNSVINSIRQWTTQKGVSPFAWNIQGMSEGNGMEVGDVRVAGASSWLIEIANETLPYTSNPSGSCYSHTSQTLADVQNWYFPHILPLFIAFSEACGVEVRPSAFPILLLLALFFLTRRR